MDTQTDGSVDDECETWHIEDLIAYRAALGIKFETESGKANDDLRNKPYYIPNRDDCSDRGNDIATDSADLAGD
jgi:hypothetical protein